VKSHTRNRCCVHCGDPTGDPDFAVCGRCVVLLDGIGGEPDDYAPPTRPKRVHDGPWLVWAARVRGCTDWFVAYGQEHGHPRKMELWSPIMVKLAVEAKMRQRG
jgi:hypothetical protein